VRLPDFFIVGHPKCGTTALHEMLRFHPGIFMPERKEPSYFVPEIVRRPLTLEGYAELFEPAMPDQRVGEATPTYLWSRTAAARIGEQCPDAKIIAILREPVDFLRSLHLEFLRLAVEDEKDFQKALSLETARAEGRRIPPNSPRPQFLPYAQHVRYVEQLERFHSVFPAERVLVLIYEEYRADNAATLRRVLDFLEVDDLPLPQVELNRSTSIRSPGLRALTRSLYLGSGTTGMLKPAITAVTTRSMRRRALRLQRRVQRQQPTTQLDSELVRTLRRSLASEVLALGEYLGRDLAGLWGYADR
jgi:Sulfotransferase domain